MKSSVISAKNLKKVAGLGILILLVAVLLSWTVLSPKTLLPQTESQISESLFQVAKTTRLFNISDGEGSYSFLFGLDFNESVSPRTPTIVESFFSLVAEQKSSAFLRGVALEIVSSSVLINGIRDSGISSMVTSNGAIVIDRLSGVDINETGGDQQLSARLIVSTVDVNYIGYFGGSEQAVTLNGTISIT